MLTTPDRNQNPFEARGLDSELAARLGAGFVNGNFVFEYRRRDRLSYRKWRTPAKEFPTRPVGAPKQFWLLDRIEALPSGQDALVIAEGEFDTIVSIQCTDLPSVSVPNGANGHRTEQAISVSQDLAFSYLWGENLKLIPELTKFRRIILAVDDDEPGRMLRDELALRIGEGRCWFVTYPKGCKDLNEVLLRYGADAVRFVLANAQPMRPGYLIKPSQIPPHRFTQTYSTGWEQMDKHLRLIRPELVVVTGKPGHGKGVWTRSMCYRLAEQYGLRTAFCTPEDPAHRLKRDMKRFAMRNNRWPAAEEQRAADAWADAHFMLTSLPEDEDLTIETLKGEMESAALIHNCQIFCMDPWNEIRHSLGNLTETKYIEDVLLDLKVHMRKLGLILVIVAHPTKLKSGEVADLYSINGSANWYNKCEHGVIVQRLDNGAGEYLDKSVIFVGKCKDQETMGTPGKVVMTFDPQKADYAEVPVAA